MGLSLFLKNFLAAFWPRQAFAAGLSLDSGSRGRSLIAVLRPLVVASLVQTSGSRLASVSSWRHAASVVAAPGLQSAGLVVMEHGLSRSTARGIFLDQGSNLPLLHW